MTARKSIGSARLVFGRPPDDVEQKMMSDYLGRERNSIEHLSPALLNTNGFVYVD